MLCYVFQTDGQLLCYFPLEADTPAAVEDADRQARQEAFYSHLSPEERKQFMAFCKGSGKKCRLDTALLANFLQKPETALFAERYGRSRIPLQYPNGLLLQLVDRSILSAMNTQYKSKDALILTLLQHTTTTQIRLDTLLLGNTSHVVRYLLNITEQVYEPEQAVPVPALCAYRQKRDGYITEEALDMVGIVLFLAQEMPKLPMFNTIQICCDKELQQLQNIWVAGKHSLFLYIYVLLTYFVSIVSQQYRSHMTVEPSGDKVCLRVYGTIPRQMGSVETTSDIDPLIRQFPVGRGLLLMLHWLLVRNGMPHTYQITETEQEKHRLEVCLYFDPIPQDEIVFRHPTDPNAWTAYLPETELLLFLLLSGGDVPEL